MANKYRGVQSPQARETEMVEREVMDPTIGIRKDASAKEIPLQAAVEAERIRFEGSAFRKEYGYTSVGSSAPQNIIALGSHKYIDDNGVEQYFLYRIYREETNQTPVIQIWNGSSWVDEKTTSETINDEKLSVISIQGTLIIADGSKILIWDERPQINTVEDDFPSGNSLTSVGDTTSVTTSDQAHDDDYTVSYDVEVSGSTDTGAELVLQIKHSGEVLKEKRYSIPGSDDDSFSETWNNVEVDFFREIASGEDVILEVTDFLSDDIQHVEEMSASGDAAVQYEATKSSDPDSPSDQYTFEYSVPTADTIGFYVNTGSGWTQVDTVSHSSSVSNATHTITQDGLGEGDKFGVNNEDGGDMTGHEVRWEENTASFSVKGHNKATDGDDPAGLVYDVEGALKSVFELLSDQAPDAQYITSFGDRVVALQDGSDPQSLAWSADGLIDIWEGADTGQIFLVDTRSDPLDDLQAAKALTSDVLAVFRKRSILRAFETGNVDQAIGVQHWIEDTGTLSPFSLVQSEEGIWFLSNHLMPTLLTESGLQMMGQPIHKELVRHVTDNPRIVESTVDHVFREWYLGVPQNGSSIIEMVYIFDIGKFRDEGERSWRKRPLNVQRMATVNSLT